MEMWLKCIILVCAAYEAVSVDDRIVSISQKNIEITVPNLGTMDVLEICYEINDKIGIDSTKLIMGRIATIADAPIPIDTVVESTLYEHNEEDKPNEADGLCKYFEGDIPESYMDREVIFSLRAHNSHITVTHAEAKFTLPATFLGESAVTSSQSVGEKTSLRFELLTALTSEGVWKICGPAEAITLHCATPDNKICYAIGVGEVSEYSLCLAATDAKSNAIFKAVTIPVSATIETAFPTDDLSDVLLTYHTTPAKNALKITPKTTVDKLEFVSYINGDTVYAVCVGENKDCELVTYEKGNKEMSILLVDLDEPKSSVITFTDYNIEGTKLGSDIIEMYWPRDAINKVGAHKYFDANIGTADGITPSVQTVLVDCSRDDPVPPTYCYAYFFGLTGSTEYLVTVAPNKNDGETWVPIMTNQIITTDAALLPVGKSTSISEITLVQNPGHAEGVLQVCYRAPENNHNYTRYEAILIDEDGHWMKIYESNQEKNMMHCFVPVNVLNTPLRVTNAMKLTVVVVEREIRGNRVLASGQADIDLSDVRVIKPEVDNGNNGSTSTLAIVGAAIAGIACLMALVAAAVMFVVKMNRNNNGLQYPLHRNNIEDSSINHGLDNPIPTM